MTDAQSARTTLPKRSRRLAGLTVAGLAGALVSPALAITPAAADPVCATPAAYGALASAELVKLGLLDLRPLGLPLGPVADVRLASANSGLNAQAEVNSGAAARLLEADLLGIDLPLGPLTRPLHQQAPPTNAEPATRSLARADLGVLSLGVGELKAHAQWDEAMACGKKVGQTTLSSASIASAKVLPGPFGRALVSVPNNLSSTSTTGLAEEGGAVRSVGAASIGVSEVRLFAGSSSEIVVKVIKPPTLRVTTAGTRDSATVQYDAPILEISAAGIASARIESPGEYVDLALPARTLGLPGARAAAESGDVPLVGSNPLDGLLKELDPDQARTGAAAGPLALPGVPGLPGLPDLPPAGEIIGGIPERLPVLGGDLALVRLSVGKLEQRITDQAVHANAASLRLQVLSGPPSRDTNGNTERRSVVDVGVGLLQAAAVAPVPAASPSPSTPPPNAGGGGGLPVTGVNVGVVAGAGLLLLAGGGGLLVATRRRRTT
ncbi:hypothetical protein AB0M79_18125 [Polymorphospora sp. NPDC051019]|uniref:hypothetical protein n=1 Tax=Polymorphospora sp. NPDC051019 TaxID=3155725 RepID=UPI0034170429